MRARHVIACIGVCLWAWAQPGLAPAQDTDQVQQDIQTLVNASHGMDWPDPPVQEALQRALATPDPYLQVVQEELVFPPDNDLFTYPDLMAQHNHSSLLYLLKLIGNAEARALLQAAYFAAADDHAILYAEFRETLKPENKPPTRTEAFTQLHDATGAALLIHNLALAYLGELGDAGVLDHALMRYEQVGFSMQSVIETYSIRITGSFPPPVTFPDLPGAITVASDDASASFSGGTFTLSGFDHTLDGAPATSGNDAHGILATSTTAQQSLLDALGGNQQNSVVGLGPTPDIAQGALDFDPAALINDLLERVTDTLTVEHTGTLGSVEEPIVAYAPGGLTLSGNLTGIGVLIVDGAFVEQGGVEWTGLVIVRADGATPPAFEMRGNVGVTGGVLLYNESVSAASLVITGSAEVRYSRAAFAMLRTALFPGP